MSDEEVVHLVMIPEDGLCEGCGQEGGMRDGKPIRIQRKRTKGWKMPEGAVYVGRPTVWGNPYVFGSAVQFRPGINTVLTTRAGLVRAFREYAQRWRDCNPEPFERLRGKDLACWCPLDQPCHADVLLEIANS